MRGRHWVGVAFAFLFLPVNVPLWDVVFEMLGLNIMAAVVIPTLFFIGLFIIFYPSKKDSIDYNPVSSAQSSEEE